MFFFHIFIFLFFSFLFVELIICLRARRYVIHGCLLFPRVDVHCLQELMLPCANHLGIPQSKHQRHFSIYGCLPIVITNLLPIWSDYFLLLLYRYFRFFFLFQLFSPFFPVNVGDHVVTTYRGHTIDTRIDPFFSLSNKEMNADCTRREATVMATLRHSNDSIDQIRFGLPRRHRTRHTAHTHSLNRVKSTKIC